MDASKTRDTYITFLLQSHQYVIELAQSFGPAFTENEALVGALQRVVAARTQEQLQELRTVIDGVISTIMRQENASLVHAQLKGQSEKVVLIQYAMFQFHALLLSLYTDVVDTDDLDLIALCDELDRRGIDSSSVVVTSMSKRGLAERILERRRRHKWLRTPEGKAYLRDLMRLRHRHHVIDPKRSRTARQAARLYADER